VRVSFLLRLAVVVASAAAATLVAHATQGGQSANVPPVGAAADSPASLIDSSRRAVRSDPETSRRLAERALELLAAQAALLPKTAF